MANRPKIATFTRFVKVDDSVAIALHTHVLGREDIVCKNPHEWFGERQNQELMVLVHEVIYSRATEGLATGNPCTASSTKPRYDFKRSGNLRALFTFKPYGCRQHLVMATEPCGFGTLTPCAAFVTEYGRKVIPFFSAPTTGSGYKPFRLLPDSLHAFVDPHELGSSLGIFKILSLLDPTHKRSLDIGSYFQPQSKDNPEAEGALPEVPVAGLQKHNGGRGRGGKRKRTRQNASSKPSNQQQQPKRQTRATSARSTQQPTIAESLARREDQPSVAASDVEVFDDPLPESIIDELFDFSSQQSEVKTATDDDSGETPVISLLDDDGTYVYVTPPLSLQSGSTRLEEERAEADKRPDPSSLLQRSDCLAQRDRELQDPHDATHHPSTVKVRRGVRGLSLKQKRSSTESFVSSFSEEDCKTAHSSHKVSHLNTSSEELFGGDCEQSPRSGRMGPWSEGACGIGSSELEVDPIDVAALFDISTPPLPPPQYSQGSRQDGSQTPPRDITDRTLVDITNTPITRPMKSPCSGYSFSPMARKHAEDLLTHLESHVNRDITEEEEEDSMTTPLQKALSDLPEHQNYLSSEVGSCNPADGEVEDVILISSGEESTPPQSQSQSQEEGRRRSKRKKKTVDLKELFKKKNHVKELSRATVHKWLLQQKGLLVAIFQRRVHSRRHEDYVTNAKLRAALHYQVNTRLFNQGQIKVITSGLMKAFCSKHMKYFTYVMSVLFPETLIRLIAEFHNVDFDQAEYMMFHGTGESDESSESEIDIN